MSKNKYVEPKNVQLHYTDKEMVKNLISLIPFNEKDSVLDAGSGKNKVWFKELNFIKDKYECELSDGNNFYEWRKEVDWIIGNPPYNESWRFTEKASSYAQKGIAWLINNQALNSHLTPVRLSFLKEKGFTLSKMHVVQDKRWFGRYYFIIFDKTKNNFLTWERKLYGKEII